VLFRSLHNAGGQVAKVTFAVVDSFIGDCVASLNTETIEALSQGDNASKDESDSQLSHTEPSVVGSDDLDVWSKVGADGENVFKLVEKLTIDAKQTGIYTPEEEMADHLETVSKWCIKSLFFLNSPNVTYEKKNFPRFDKFLASGTELSSSRDVFRTKLDDEDLSKNLVSRWVTLVDNQLTRLRNLQKNRDKFISWSKEAQQVMTGKGKRLSIAVLSHLATQSLDYPSGSEMVQKVRTLSNRANIWSALVTKSFESENKMTMQEAKELFDEGEQLKISCDKLKVLRNALKGAKSWLNRVKRSNFVHGETSSSDVAELIDEHESLDVSLPDEIQKLKQAMKGYCVCRRPYEGFMIGCDSCDEWYHGTCIGVSEAQAERFDKYVCIRCAVEKTFYASANLVVSVIRKWTCRNDLKKSRQNEYQRHQRRVRKEKKDIGKLESEKENLVMRLLSLDQSHLSIIEHAIGSSSSSNKAMISGSDKESIPIPDCSPSRLTSESCSSRKCDTKAHIQKVQTQSHNDSYDCVKHTCEINHSIPFFTPDAVMTPGVPVKKSADDAMDETASIFTQAEQLQDLKAGSIQSAISFKNQSLSLLNGLVDTESENEKEVLIKQIGNISLAIKICQERLRILMLQARERNDLEREEDSCRDAMFRWCVRIRSNILVPSTLDLAEKSRPTVDGSISAAMKMAFQEAEYLNIANLHDFHQVTNSFRCLAWSALAMQTLARKPSLVDFSDLISQCSTLTLPDEKAVRMIKAMIQRTTQWQLRASKVLTASSGETKPFNMEALQSLQDTESEIPLEVPEMETVSCSILDKGKRHCICGGPNDGTFMLGCDKCGLWFHGRCVDIPKVIEGQLEEWICPPCGGNFCVTTKGPSSSCTLSETVTEEKNLPSATKNEIIPHAPTISKLWPPFGLLKSPESIVALGDDCCTIPDDSGPLLPPSKRLSSFEIMQCTDKLLNTRTSVLAAALSATKKELHPPTESMIAALNMCPSGLLVPPRPLVTNKITPLSSPEILLMESLAVQTFKKRQRTEGASCSANPTASQKKTRKDIDRTKHSYDPQKTVSTPGALLASEVTLSVSEGTVESLVDENESLDDLGIIKHCFGFSSHVVASNENVTLPLGILAHEKESFGEILSSQGVESLAKWEVDMGTQNVQEVHCNTGRNLEIECEILVNALDKVEPHNEISRNVSRFSMDQKVLYDAEKALNAEESIVHWPNMQKTTSLELALDSFPPRTCSVGFLSCDSVSNQMPALFVARETRENIPVDPLAPTSQSNEAMVTNYG